MKPWEMEKLTHRDLWDLETKHRLEEAQARSDKGRL